MRRQRLLVALLTLALASHTYAAGTTAMNVLNIDFGSVSGAMGKANVARVGSKEGVIHNPATILSMKENISLVTAVNPYIFSTLWMGTFAYRDNRGFAIFAGGKRHLA